MSTAAAPVGERAERDEHGRRPVRRALVSVYDKTGVDELARGLAAAGVELVSTGSTAGRIAAAGVSVTTVEDVTGFPECLDGRVKTLHPSVHAGLLADPARPEHDTQLAGLGIGRFDLLVVNLYPFAETVAAGAEPRAVVEQVDIGGPAMVRAAAKNHAAVAVVVDPGRYDEVLAAVGRGGFSLAERTALAAEAFAHTAGYDVAVATWFAGQVSALERDSVSPGRVAAGTASDAGSASATGAASATGTASATAAESSTGAASATGTSSPTGAASPAEAATEPAFAGITGTLVSGLRYGENPHQRAALYRTSGVRGGLAAARQLAGKAMSYNNYVDTDAAWRAAHDHAAPAVAVVKHANPCGIAVAGRGVEDEIADAHAKAHACDPVSAFGGVVATNRTLTRAMAAQVAEVFTEVVAAPGFEPEAVELLAARRSLRLVVVPELRGDEQELRAISGGFLVQTPDRVDAAGDEPATWRLAAGPQADAAVVADLAFAWRAVRAVRSNGILLARDGASVGIGMGQVNRVDSCRLAVSRAGEERASGAVAASDAFFPFPDGLQVLLDAGVRAVVQPGGSKRDGEVIAAAEAAGVSLYFTGVRHFAH